MHTSRSAVWVMLTAGLVLSSTSAEARFGKRSSSSRSEGKHRASPAGSSSGGSGSQHLASPVGSPSRSPAPAVQPRPGWRGWFAPSFSFWSWRPYRYYVPQPQATQVEQQEEQQAEEPSGLFMRAGLSGQVFAQGGALEVAAGLEGQHWGFDVRHNGLALLAEDGSGATDSIRLFSTHLTYAPWSGEHSRLRLEAGLSTAHAPDVTFLGPSLGLSAEACLFGPLDVEGRVQLVPLPHRQLDAQAGLAAHLGVMVLRGGWRLLVLDDAGWLGVRSVEVLSGPYIGLGVML